jgi:hypothetical protein
MTQEEYNRKFNELLKSNPQVGEVIENDRACPVYSCRHTGRPMVKVTVSCLVDHERGPHRMMHYYGRFGLNVYLNDPSKKHAKKIKITKVGPKSAWCDVLE